MNIYLPPIEPCPIAWRKFCDWLDVKMGQDSLFSGGAPEQSYNLSFRGNEFRHCPFCGECFDMTEPHSIRERHS